MQGNRAVLHRTTGKGLPRHRWSTFAGAGLLALALHTVPVATAQADILRVPDGGYIVMEGEGLPSRGQTQSTVLGEHGEPDKRHATVGDPPITRWDYDGFSVVFEGEYVLHSIVRSERHPRQP